MVLGCGAKPGLADSHTITTCCALRCLPQPLPASTLVIVELQLVQNLEIARQVAGRAGSSALSVVPCCVGLTLTLTLTLAAANPNPNLKPGAVLRRPRSGHGLGALRHRTRGGPRDAGAHECDL